MANPRSRLLVLTTYPRTAATTRFRACAYFDALAARGIDAELHSFFDAAFFAQFYGRGARLSKGLGLLRASLDRLRLVMGSRDVAGVFVQRGAAIWGPALIEAVFARLRNVPLIFDFDDALWLDDGRRSLHPILARLLKSPGKTDQLLRMATQVIAGSEYLAAYAARLNQRVLLSPTVVSRETWTPLPGRLEGDFSNPDMPIIGWVGTHSTAASLDLVFPVLESLAKEGERFRLRLVGASREVSVKGVAVDNVPWSESREVQDFQQIDIGIAPVIDDAFGRGKCGFKQIQYMTVGVPFVSSPVGGAREIVRHNENGLLANSPAEWKAGLRALLHDRAVRSRLARAGRLAVEANLSAEAQAGRVVDVVERAIRRTAQG